MKELRVVFDCMIFLQAVLNEKSLAFKLFEELERNSFTLFISNEVIDEVSDVLNREDIRVKYQQITDELNEMFLKRVLQKAVLIKSVSRKLTYSRDPKDEKYINLAIEAEADYLVTRDKDLLDLMTEISVEGKQFRQTSRPLKIVDPIEFLKSFSKKN